VNSVYDKHENVVCEYQGEYAIVALVRARESVDEPVGCFRLIVWEDHPEPRWEAGPWTSFGETMRAFGRVVAYEEVHNQPQRVATEAELAEQLQEHLEKYPE